MLTILFDGIAYGMLLFVLACGLSVTLGLMNFVNLAHGSFAMAGGYITLVLVNRVGVPFFPGLVVAFIATALVGAVLVNQIEPICPLRTDQPPLHLPNDPQRRQIALWQPHVNGAHVR